MNQQTAVSSTEHLSVAVDVKPQVTDDGWLGLKLLHFMSQQKLS